MRVYARKKTDPDDPDGYTMPHSAITPVLDPQRQYVTHFTDAFTGVEVEQRLRPLLCADG